MHRNSGLVVQKQDGALARRVWVAGEEELARTDWP
jgi:hypothetical protein